VAILRVLLLTALACVNLGCSERDILLADHPEYEIEDIKSGSGIPAKMGDQITAQYTLALPGGELLVDITGHKSHTWTLGDETVIAGVDESVIGMRPGGVRRVQLPPDLHYGEDGYANGVIPPKTPLMLEIALVRVR
jgi:FKBP-type peptidyl-prolyl cis-trans isomerase